MNDLLKKFIEFGFGNIVTLILGFISSPIITRLIMPDDFGKFSMFNTVTNLFLIIVMLGLDQSFARFYYEENSEGRSVLLRKCMKIPLIINIIASIIAIILYKYISIFIVREYSMLLIIMLIIQNTFNLLGRFSLLSIRMEQKGRIYSMLQIIGKALYIIFVILFVKVFNHDYRTLVFALVLSNIIVVIISILIEKKEFFYVKSKIKIKTTTKEMIRYGIPLIFSMAITWVFNSTDKVMISMYSNYTEVGLYSSAFSIVALLNAVQGTFTTFWVPVANEKYVDDPNDTKFFENINNMISLIMLLMAILLITFKDLIILLLGSKYREASFIFPFLIFVPVMYTISETTVLGINFKKKTKYHIWIAIISAIINIIGNITLVPIMGAKGAAIATGISYIIFFLSRTLISRKLYYVNYHLKSFCISIIFISLLALYSSFYNFDLIMFILSIISLVITIFLYRSTITIIIFNIKKIIKRK